MYYVEGHESSEHTQCCMLPEVDYPSRQTLTVPVVPVALSHGSRIYDLLHFQRTVQESKDLRSYVIAASFCSNLSVEYPVYPLTRLRNDRTPVNDTIRLLAPSLQFLHLTPGEKWENTHLMLTKNLYTSLSRTAYEAGLYFHTNTKRCEVATRYKFFELFYRIGPSQQPPLQRLVLREVEHWGCFCRCPVGVDHEKLPSDMEIPLNMEGVSNITSLSFPESVNPGPDLVEVLSWPKALTSFEIEVNRYFPGHWTRLPPPTETEFSPKIFADAMWSQHLFLEMIDISADDETEQHESTLGDLQEYSKLRLLGVPIGFLIHDDNTVLTDSVLSDSTVSGTSCLLPQSLEVLRIGFGYHKSPKELQQLTDEKFDHFRSWIGGIASLKDSCYPNLHSIMLWHGGAIPSSDYPDEGPSKHIAEYSDMKWSPKCREVLTLMENAGIDFCVVSCGMPPPWSKRPKRSRGRPNTITVHGE